MSIEVDKRVAYYTYSEGYNNPALFGAGFNFAFGDEDGGDFGDIEQCAIEFDVAPYTVDTSRPVSLTFTGDGFAIGTKHLRRWTGPWPTNLSMLQTTSYLSDDTNQITFTDSGNVTVDFDIANLVADALSAGQLTILLGFPEDEPYDFNYVNYEPGDRPTLDYTWYRDDFESYSENREVSTIAGWTTNSVDVIVGTHNSSKRAGLLGSTQTGYMERTMDANGTLTYDYRANASSDVVRVWVNGVNVKTHTASAGTDSVSVLAGQVVRFDFVTNLGPSYVDNLSLAISAESKVLDVTLDAITLFSEGKHSSIGTATDLSVDSILLSAASLTAGIGQLDVTLDDILFAGEGTLPVRGSLSELIVIGFEADGENTIQGTGLSGDITIGLLASNVPVEGTLNITLDDILLTGEIPQGGRPVVGGTEANPENWVITVFLEEALGFHELEGELTVSPIIITLYGRSQGDPSVEADSPFLDPKDQIILGDKNATLRSSP